MLVVAAKRLLWTCREPGPITAELWIFAIPGIGRYFVAAAQTRDYPLTLGLTIVLTSCVLAVNALSDIALPRSTRASARPSD